MAKFARSHTTFNVSCIPGVSFLLDGGVLQVMNMFIARACVLVSATVPIIHGPPILANFCPSPIVLSSIVIPSGDDLFCQCLMILRWRFG